MHPSEALTLTLPAGWEEREHEGTPYYEHAETGEKSWVHPSENDDGAASAEIADHSGGESDEEQK